MKKSIAVILTIIPCIFLASASSAALADETPISCTVDSDGNTQCSDNTDPTTTDCGDICQIVNNPADTPEPIDCSADPSPCERGGGGVVIYDKQIANTGIPTNTPEGSPWWNVFDSPKLIFTILFWVLLSNAATVMLLHTFYFRDAIVIRHRDCDDDCDFGVEGKDPS